MNLPIMICLVYLAISLIVGLLPGLNAKKTVTNFIAADSSMSAMLMYFIMGAAIFSSFAFLGTPAWAYSRLGAVYFILAYGFIGIVPLYFLGPKARRTGQRLGAVTQAELLAKRFDSQSLSVLLALLTVVVLIPYLTVQMKGAALIMYTVSNGAIPLWFGAALTYGVVLVYVLFSGISGVGWTNAFQGALMMVVAAYLGWYVPHTYYGGVTKMFAALVASNESLSLNAPGLASDKSQWSWVSFSSWIAISAIGMSCWPHLFMKSFVAGSEKSLRLSVVLYPTYHLFLFPLALIGFAAILVFPGVEPADSIVPYLLTQSGLPAFVIGLMCAATLAASMSSGDTILHAAASVAVRDGIKPLLRRDLPDRVEKRMILLCLAVIFSVAYYFAIISSASLVAIIVAAYGGVAQLMPVLLAAFYWRHSTAAGVIAGLVSGLTVNAIFLVIPDARPWVLHEGVYGLTTNVIALVVVSKLTTSPPKSVVALFFR